MFELLEAFLGFQDFFARSPDRELKFDLIGAPLGRASLEVVSHVTRTAT